MEIKESITALVVLCVLSGVACKTSPDAPHVEESELLEGVDPETEGSVDAELITVALNISGMT